MRQGKYLQRGIAAVMLIAVWFANFSVFGQKPGGKAAAPSGTAMAGTKTAAKSECKGNYTGQVTYRREIKQQHGGRYGSTYDRTYVYQSTIQIRDDGTTQGSMYADYNGVGGSFSFLGKASATLTENLNDLSVSEKDDYCKLTLRGAEGKTRVRCQARFQRNIQAAGEGDVNVFLGFKGDKYKISLDNPAVSGSGTETSNTSCSGTCSPDKPLNHSRPLTITRDKPSGTYTDEMPLNPNNLNRISGSFTRPSGEETVTITWNLVRCAPPMEIEDLTFEHHRFPDPTKWVGIDTLGGTTDGNLVKVKARVFNNTGETGYATVKFSEVTTGAELPDSSVSIAIEAGRSRDVEYEWDTSGYAWDESGKPAFIREIKAEIQGGSSVTQKLKLLPKPIVMAHGLWSNAGAWAPYPGFLRDAHSSMWRGYAVGTEPEHGKMNTGDHPGNYLPTNTVYQNAQELAKQVKYTREENNAWHIDIVAHSMGGLISRRYIHSLMEPVFDGKPAVTHLVMLGTPNMGSPCADVVDLVFRGFDQNEMHAMRELKPAVVEAMNREVTNKKGVKFSILIGAFMPRTCLDENRWGDGVVPVESAKYNNTDYRYVFRNHIALTGKEDFEAFVLPRLAIGPKKAKAEQAQAADRIDQDETLYKRVEEKGFASYFRNASFTDEQSVPDGPAEAVNLTTKQKVELAANETKTIDIPVENGEAAGVVLAAPLAVGAVLTDETGTVVGESKGGMDALKDLFRAISVRKPIKQAMWKLTLQNLGNAPVTVFVGGVSSSNAVSDLVIAAKRAAGETASVTVKWVAGGRPVLTANIAANLPNGSAIELVDDGKHGDGAAGDGVFGGSIPKAGAADKFVEVRAESEGLVRIGVGQIEEKAGSPAVAPVKRAGRSKS